MSAEGSDLRDNAPREFADFRRELSRRGLPLALIGGVTLFVGALLAAALMRWRIVGNPIDARVLAFPLPGLLILIVRWRLLAGDFIGYIACRLIAAGLGVLAVLTFVGFVMSWEGSVLVVTMMLTLLAFVIDASAVGVRKAWDAYRSDAVSGFDPIMRADPVAPTTPVDHGTDSVRGK